MYKDIRLIVSLARLANCNALPIEGTARRVQLNVDICVCCIVLPN